MCRFSFVAGCDGTWSRCFFVFVERVLGSEEGAVSLVPFVWPLITIRRRSWTGVRSANVSKSHVLFPVVTRVTTAARSLQGSPFSTCWHCRSSSGEFEVGLLSARSFGCRSVGAHRARAAGCLSHASVCKGFDGCDPGRAVNALEVFVGTRVLSF